MGTTQESDSSVDPGKYERVDHRRANQRNSNGTMDITLPKDQVEKYDISDGDEIAVVVCSDGMFISPSFDVDINDSEAVFSSGVLAGEEALESMGDADE